MPISPKDAAAENDQNSNAKLAAAEKKLDAALKSAYRTRRAVHIEGSTLKTWLPDWVDQRDLLDRYRAAGWEVKNHSDQREGTDYYVFTSKRDED